MGSDGRSEGMTMAPGAELRPNVTQSLTCINAEGQQISGDDVRFVGLSPHVIILQMIADVGLRPVTSNDEAFLLRLYATTRPEIDHFGWGEAEKQAFVAMQFQMQTRSYAMQFPDAEISVITVEGEDAGRVIVNRTPTAISLTDIAVLPEFRGKGIATTVIERLQEEAARTDRDIKLSVERMNERAFQLYRSLGFEVTGEDQVYLTMRWLPANQKAAK
jgi:ribosomal protein S18 acetylase RimI-like enzyme